jgi:hypothetical protein
MLIQASVLLLGISIVNAVNLNLIERTSSILDKKNRGNCFPKPGNLTIHHHQLYPENLNYDHKNHLRYLSCVYYPTGY